MLKSVGERVGELVGEVVGSAKAACISAKLLTDFVTSDCSSEWRRGRGAAARGGRGAGQ